MLDTAVRPVPVPKDIAGVDAAWLTQALQGAFPGIEVERAEVVKNFGGASTKLRVELQTNRPDFPPTVVVKGCFEPHSKTMRAVQLLEVQAYTGLVGELGVETIRVFFGGLDEEGWGALIMEDLDLRGVTCLRAVEPIASFETAAAFLDETARIHARWWGAPELADEGAFGWLAGPRDVAQGLWRDILLDEARFAERLGRPRMQAISTKLRDRHRLLAANDAVFANPHGFPLVMVHGDMHPANLYLTSEGRPGFLDWIPRRSTWAQDVNYFIVGGLDPTDRRSWERALLQHYRDRLIAYGVTPPDYETAWLAHRQYTAWGALTWFLNTTDYHTETMITAMAHRFGAAMTDHDTLGLLGL